MMNIFELCKCGGGEICGFCRVMVVIALAGVIGMAVYLISRKKRKKSK